MEKILKNWLLTLFYEGDNRLKNKKTDDIYFATLQSKFAQSILNKKGIEIKLDTLYYLKNDKIYSK